MFMKLDVDNSGTLSMGERVDVLFARATRAQRRS